MEAPPTNFVEEEEEENFEEEEGMRGGRRKKERRAPLALDPGSAAGRWWSPPWLADRRS